MTETGSLQSHLTSVSFLLRALKAPIRQSDSNSKIAIARAAWTSNTLYIPRKADVLREWILEAWLRVKPSPLADSAYHRLLLDIFPQCTQSIQPPLTLLASFFRNLAQATSIDPELYPAATETFAQLFNDPDRVYKAEGWADVWIEMSSFLAAGTGTTLDVTAALRPLVTLVCGSLQQTLTSSPNGKKIAQTISPHLPTYAVALSLHPSLRETLKALTGQLFLPVSVLQTADPLGPLLASFVDKTDSSILHFVPHLFDVLIHRYNSERHATFNQPSSSRLAYDVYISDRLGEAVRKGLERVMEVVDGFDEAKGNALGTWQCRLDVWSVVEDWGGYLETDDRWGSLISRAARRAQGSLVESGTSAETILHTLEVFERLDHTRTALSPAVLGWCLAAPAHCRTAALSLLRTILRYHHLTQSLSAFLSLLCDSVEGLFPVELPDDVARTVYQLVANGPLVTPAFEVDLCSAAKASIGTRDLPLQLLERLQRLEIPPASADRKRSRSDVIFSASSGTIGIISRVIASCIAARGATEEPAMVIQYLRELVDRLDEESRPRSKRSKSPTDSAVGRDSWARDILVASGIRGLRACPNAARRLNAEPLVMAFCNAACLPELRFEIARHCFEAFSASSSSLSSSYVDGLLDIVSQPLDVTWSGNAAMTAAELPAALWQMMDAAILESMASPEQLALLLAIIAKKVQAGRRDRDVAERFMRSASMWESASMRKTILNYVEDRSHDPFAFLNLVPLEYLPRPNRTELLVRAFENDDSRLCQREWTARMAKETGNIGPLMTDTKLLQRLARTDDPKSMPATLELLAVCYSQICRSPERIDLLRLLLQDFVAAKPFRGWAKRIKADTSATTTADLHSQAAMSLLTTCRDVYKGKETPLPIRDCLHDLTNVVVANVGSAASAVLSREDHFHLHDQVIQFWREVSSLPDANLKDPRLVQALVSIVVQSGSSTGLSKPLENAAVAALDLVSRYSGEDTAKVLATFVMLATAAPSDSLTALLSTSIGAWSKEAYAIGFASLIQLHATKKYHDAACQAIATMLASRNEGSGKTVSAYCHSLVQHAQDTAHSASTLHVLWRLVEDRPRALHLADLGSIWLVLKTALSPSNHPRCDRSDIFPRIIGITLGILRHRCDLVLATLPHAVSVVCAIFPLLQHVRVSVQHSRAHRERVVSQWPWWLTSGMGVEAASETSRLLTLLANAHVSGTRDGLAGPLAKHAPAILVAYVRAASDPLAALSTEVRKELEPGLFAVCDIVTAGGRAQARGREGEGLGIPFGLGDKGEVELEVWADLWKTWSRKRYTGQG